KYGGNPYGEALQSGMRLTYRRICPQCKNVFETQKSNKRFCSEACRKTFWILNRHSPKYEAELARKKREKTTRAFKKE
ncbi:MAG: hypothetical protein QXL54_05140, partial [Candidatus Bathyarchaeia archaeon]